MEKTKKEIYPEHLTENQSEHFEFEPFNDSDSYANDLKYAKDYIKIHGGQLYTMIDGEDNKTYYWKGLHYVNRFGFCVLKK